MCFRLRNLIAYQRLIYESSGVGLAKIDVAVLFILLNRSNCGSRLELL
jgi:hypothetical protein